LASKKSAKVSAHETGCSIYGFRTGEILKKLDQRALVLQR
jgi:hypothetical protein